MWNSVISKISFFVFRIWVANAQHNLVG